MSSTSSRPYLLPPVGVYGRSPPSENLPLRLVLLAVLPFDLQDEGRPIGQPDQEVRPEFRHHPKVHVEDFKPDMVILDPGRDVWISVENERLGCFPRAVEHTPVD